MEFSKIKIVTEIKILFFFFFKLTFNLTCMNQFLQLEMPNLFHLRETEWEREKEEKEEKEKGL